jgi:hypothetical protein
VDADSWFDPVAWTLDDPRGSIVITAALVVAMANLAIQL